MRRGSRHGLPGPGRVAGLGACPSELVVAVPNDVPDAVAAQLTLMVTLTDGSTGNEPAGHLGHPDAAFAWLTDAGATEVWPPADAVAPGARFGYVKDPEGNLIELIQPATPGQRGGAC